MPLFQLVLILLAVGLLVYGVHWVPWVDAFWKRVIIIIIAVVVVFWLLNVFGIIPLINQVRI